MYIFMVEPIKKWGGVWLASAVRLSKMRTSLTPLPRVPSPTDLLRTGSVRSYFTYEESIGLRKCQRYLIFFF